MTDPYDLFLEMVDACEGIRISQRYGIFASAAPAGYRVCETNPDGTFLRMMADDLNVQEAIAMTSKLNAEDQAN